MDGETRKGRQGRRSLGIGGLHGEFFPLFGSRLGLRIIVSCVLHGGAVRHAWVDRAAYCQKGALCNLWHGARLAFVPERWVQGYKVERLFPLALPHNLEHRHRLGIGGVDPGIRPALYGGNSLAQHVEV